MRRELNRPVRDDPLETDFYVSQNTRWPVDGKHILAHFDDDSIVVYQAYRDSIAEFVLACGVFGGDFSYSRMSWIKPNFLWMMYRSGWGTKEGQERVLGLRLRRRFFDFVVAQAVASSFEQSGFSDRDAWKKAIGVSDVRLQWDPDHDPVGNAMPRRAIQLGLRGEALEQFGKRELVEVIDLTAFVAEQRETLLSSDFADLRMPVECVYVPTSQ